MIRHAEAEGNIYRRAHGHYNGLITRKGYSQIERLRERFKSERINAVYSSDLTRTIETAKALSVPRDLEIITTEKLREIGFGTYEDIAWGNMEHSDPQMSALFNSDPANWHVPGSESYESVLTRLTGFIVDVAVRHEGESIALFSHGFAIRAYITKLLGYKSHESNNVKYHDNTAVTVLHYEDGEISIKLQGDNSHLSTLDSTLAHQSWWREEKNSYRENLRYTPLDEEADMDILDAFIKEIGRRPAADLVYSAFLADEPVGLLGLCEAKENADKAGWVSYIYIKPEFQRTDYGIQLIGHAVSLSRKANKEFLRIDAVRDSFAYRLCLSDGFICKSDSGTDCVLEKSIRNW